MTLQPTTTRPSQAHPPTGDGPWPHLNVLARRSLRTPPHRPHRRRTATARIRCIMPLTGQEPSSRSVPCPEAPRGSGFVNLPRGKLGNLGLRLDILMRGRAAPDGSRRGSGPGRRSSPGPAEVSSLVLLRCSIGRALLGAEAPGDPRRLGLSPSQQVARAGRMLAPAGLDPRPLEREQVPALLRGRGPVSCGL